MHINKNSKGSSVERFEADDRRKEFKPSHRHKCLGTGSQPTMFNGIRIDRNGNPRSKTWSYKGRR